MKRRQFLGATAATMATLTVDGEAIAASRRKPNFIVILCDDLGWGDIEPEGGKAIRTPNLNRMAAEGNVLTDYYAPQNIALLRSLVPTSQILFGTDYDRFPLLHSVERLATLDLPPDVRAAIESANARRLFPRWHS